MTGPALEVGDLVERLQEVERRLDAHDATLARIGEAVRTLAWGTVGPFPAPVGRKALAQLLGDIPTVPDDSSVHPTPRDGFPVERPK